MRVLIVSHAHPKVVTGGGQLAAHRLHSELKKHAGVTSCFLAWAPRPAVSVAPFSTIGTDGTEVLFHTTSLNPFTFSQENTWFVTHDFPQLLDRFEPDVVHFGHYIGAGIDLIREVRNRLPRAPIVLTLHEFLAICHNGGKMVKTRNNHELCQKAGFRDCNLCFPSISPGEFFLRERFVKSHFDLVDRFIAPSRFLKERYVDWGLPSDRIDVLDNGSPDNSAPVPPTRSDRIRFSFFGKVFELKGIFVFLKAIELLSPEVRDACEFSLWGAGIDEESEGVQREYSRRLDELGSWVHAYGSYDPDDVGRYMAATDWLVVPSLWWENSPLVIQEAFMNRVPVICSGVGGMAEKVRNGIDGIHFRIGDPRDLANAITTAATTPGLRDKLARGVARPPTMPETVQQHLGLYETLMMQRNGVAAISNDA